MKRIGFFGLLAISSIIDVEAKIGETKEQCKARYQDAERPNRFDNVFSKSGLNTDCTFDKEGKCVVVGYRILFVGVLAEEALGKRPRFTDEQVRKMLDLNSGGSEWEKKSDDKHGTPVDGKYVTKDGSRQAMVNFTGVTIESVAYVERLKEMAKPEAVDAVVNEVTK